MLSAAGIAGRWASEKRQQRRGSTCRFTVHSLVGSMDGSEKCRTVAYAVGSGARQPGCWLAERVRHPGGCYASSAYQVPS